MLSEDFKRLSVRKQGAQLIEKEGLERIHDATLEVLEKTGLRVYSPKALELLRKNGAQVDAKTMVAKLPKDLVEKSIRNVPHELTLRARNPKYDLSVDGNHVYFTFDGCGIEAIDLETGERRYAEKKDIVNTAKIADALPGIGYYTPPVAPQDVPRHAHVLHQIHTAYSTTEKFVMSESTTTEDEARVQVEMASLLAGGYDKIWSNPNLCAVICTVSPLVLDGGGSEAAIEFAKAGVPIMAMSMCQTGVSGPMTLAGTLVVSNAEILGLITLAQCARKGARVFYNSTLSTMEPRTGAYVSGSPESALLCGGVIEIGRHYKMPTQAGAFGTNALMPGSQAATEHCLTAVLSMNAGADLVNGFGLLEGSTVLSYAQVMLDYDLLTEILYSIKGIEVNDDTLAKELIKEVGIGGTYLAKRHTLSHLMDVWRPYVFEHTNTEDWTKRGAVEPVKKATEKAKAVLKEHETVHLDKDVQKDLDAILRKGEKALSH